VSSELLLSRVSGNLPETTITSLVEYDLHFAIYRITCKTGWRTKPQRTKTVPTIHINLLTTLTGDCLNQNGNFDKATELP